MIRFQYTDLFENPLIRFGISAVIVTFLSSLVFGAIYMRYENLIGVSLLHDIGGVCAFASGVL